MTNEERITLARRVKEKAGGRVPVVVGATFEGGLEEQAKLMNTMGEFADCVVIITNQIATMEEVIHIIYTKTSLHADKSPYLMAGECQLAISDGELHLIVKL